MGFCKLVTYLQRKLIKVLSAILANRTDWVDLANSLSFFSELHFYSAPSLYDDVFKLICNVYSLLRETNINLPSQKKQQKGTLPEVDIDVSMDQLINNESVHIYAYPGKNVEIVEEIPKSKVWWVHSYLFPIHF